MFFGFISVTKKSVTLLQQQSEDVSGSLSSVITLSEMLKMIMSDPSTSVYSKCKKRKYDLTYS
jgi:hypothetical protein